MKDNVKHDPTSPMYHIHLSDYLLSKQSSKKKGSRRGYDYNNTSLAYGNERFIKMKTTCVCISEQSSWTMEIVIVLALLV